MGYPVEYGGQDAVARAIASFETLAYGDLSLLVKCGVQFGLFGGAVLHLGTARHHERYLQAVARLELPGCFAMTETGHGSNVQALPTTATYDPDTEEFVVHTPDDDARKDYIGGAARDGAAPPRGATPSGCSATASATCSRPPAPGSTSSCSRRSPMRPPPARTRRCGPSSTASAAC